MKPARRISGEARRAAIIHTARKVFVEKGFHRTTTRELAEAAGVSEALLYKHFPSKDALYAAILTSCFDEEGEKSFEHLRSLEPSTRTLVYLVDDLISHVLEGKPDEDERSFLRLILRSLMDEGQFARVAIQGRPQQWVEKVEACLKAAKRAGDLTEQPVRASLAGWMVHQLIAGIVLHSLPADAVVDYGVTPKELVRQVVRFCLRGMGLKEESIRRWHTGQGGR